MDINNWLWPQWVIVILWIVALLCTAAMHDKPMVGKYNVLNSIVRISLFGWVLICGGFFK